MLAGTARLLEGYDDIVVALNVVWDKGTLEQCPIIGDGFHVIARAMNGQIDDRLAVV